MYTRLARARRAIPVFLGAITLAGVAALLVWDVAPALFPARAHDLLGAFPLAMIALAYLAYQAIHRPSLAEWLKAILLAVAFLFWALNQFWRDPPRPPSSTTSPSRSLSSTCFWSWLVGRLHPRMSPLARPTPAPNRHPPIAIQMLRAAP